MKVAPKITSFPAARWRNTGRPATTMRFARFAIRRCCNAQTEWMGSLPSISPHKIVERPDDLIPRLPVCGVVSASHYVADLTLGLGRSCSTIWPDFERRKIGAIVCLNSFGATGVPIAPVQTQYRQFKELTDEILASHSPRRNRCRRHCHSRCILCLLGPNGSDRVDGDKLCALLVSSRSNPACLRSGGRNRRDSLSMRRKMNV